MSAIRALRQLARVSVRPSFAPSARLAAVRPAVAARQWALTSARAFSSTPRAFGSGASTFLFFAECEGMDIVLTNGV